MSRGFTLLEILLAISILAMISTLIYGGFAQTALNKARIDENVDHYRTIHMALERMSRELSTAFVSTHVNPSPTLQTVRTAFVADDNGRRDRIDFTSFSHRRLYRDSHESDQNEISYFVANHPDKSGVQVLARREQKRIDEEPTRGGRVQIVAENIEEFDLEYFDPVGGNWTKTWDTTQPAGQPNRLPAQVKIKLVVNHPRIENREEVFGTRVIIPLTWALNHANYNP